MDSSKGRTIRKVWGGGTFSTCTNIFSNFWACVDNFFKYNPLLKFFFISTYVITGP